ncbi:hypothetical protein O6H91_22G029100 [Diphasiastrum complanatum]|uniref:Uncharacterized protein n=4 Tax=Diphasiastrum complanatum TaxID=34168 RepID=A0ACC2AE10_DIPCM|nr:hypothetical protein O6H91_22G028400 [Diphasiastrum complanatum]KAJ7515801.1 hypothetical protein O6H91_22G028400 [Diphasiastrum complanatum]KAJ7515802.1 hypothetical protein O6H91_22G028400 [Diphasiastrum complanatum]KAJ7515822.1 hypothetical protein O6H91_22G029100 [Diphasiastrum complanatum]
MKEAKPRKGDAAVSKREVKKASKSEEKDVKKKKQLSVKDPKATKRQRRKERKAKKDPNQPKRPPTAFFIFLEEFRKTYKEQHPNVKGVAAVGKAGGDKWKELSDAEKAPYIAKASQRKIDYDKSMAAYKQKQDEEEGSAEESDKSNLEINDDEESEEEEEDDDD